MKYRLFLFDLDDTLLDFKASERLSLANVLADLGLSAGLDAFYFDYQRENAALWQAFEQGGIDKAALKVERFRRTFALHGIAADPEVASAAYLAHLPNSVVLVDGARATCEALAEHGQIGIITNGFDHVQRSRIAASGLADLVAFVATSEACGHAKPDVRFFEYSARLAPGMAKTETIIIGDRLEADVLGGNRFGIDSCWFNPHGLANTTAARPTLQVAGLADLLPQLMLVQ